MASSTWYVVVSWVASCALGPLFRFPVRTAPEAVHFGLRCGRLSRPWVSAHGAHVDAQAMTRAWEHALSVNFES